MRSSRRRVCIKVNRVRQRGITLFTKEREEPEYARPSPEASPPPGASHIMGASIANTLGLSNRGNAVTSKGLSCIYPLQLALARTGVGGKSQQDRNF
jgi:hypothetical protein